MEEEPGANLKDGRTPARAELAAGVEVRIEPAGAAGNFADRVPGHFSLGLEEAQSDTP